MAAGSRDTVTMPHAHSGTSFMGRDPEAQSSPGSQSWMKSSLGTVMGRRVGVFGYSGKTELDKVAGPQLSHQKARQ